VIFKQVKSGFVFRDMREGFRHLRPAFFNLLQSIRDQTGTSTCQNRLLNLSEKHILHHQYHGRHTRQSQPRNGTIM
jgi:hypothetical protein